MNQEERNEPIELPPEHTEERMPDVEHTPSIPLNERIFALVEVIFCSGIVSSLLATLPLLLLGIDPTQIVNRPKLIFFAFLVESFILITMIVLFQRSRHQKVKDLGFNVRNLKANVIIGLGIVPVLFFIGVVVSLFFKYYLPKYYVEKNPLLEIIQSRSDLGFFIGMGLIAGFKEEIQRAFILLRFDKYLFGAPLGLVLWSIAFGAGHRLQEFQGVITTGLLGFCFGLLFLTRKNLISPIVAHASYDVLALLLWFSLRGLTS